MSFTKSQMRLLPASTAPAFVRDSLGNPDLLMPVTIPGSDPDVSGQDNDWVLILKELE